MEVRFGWSQKQAAEVAFTLLFPGISQNDGQTTLKLFIVVFLDVIDMQKTAHPFHINI
ncbi:hypothetical protein IMPERIA89_430011 [Imperialibacter sp. 89]|nr:hypothetical protein IMPERIA89_430011 [Imperialibacter sp. 89]CAD5291923.1 hypothetical protein IMPERIA75_640011 [Imperialibacter sp. 75]